MKKLFALGLAVVMVLAFAAVSMAATVTTGGELQFGKAWIDKDVAGQDAEANVSNAKITFTAQIADDIKAFAAFKGNAGAAVNVDEAWTQFTEDFGTIKVGYFGYGQNQKDLIDVVIQDVKSGLTATYAGKLTDQVTLNLAAANDGTANASAPQGLDYSVGLAYDADVFGANINYFKFALTNDCTAYSINAYYKLDALKLYFQYEKANYAQNGLLVAADNATDTIIGGVYDSADVPLFVRAEYDLSNQGMSSNNWGLRLAYKMNDNVKFQYTMKHKNALVDYVTNELLMITTF